MNSSQQINIIKIRHEVKENMMKVCKIRDGEML